MARTDLSILAVTNLKGLMKKEYISPKTADNAVFVTTSDFMPIIEERIATGHSVELAIRGRSMLPTLKEGRDSVILSPINGELKRYDIPLYRRKNQRYVIHRIVGISDGKYRLAGDNQYVYEDGIEKGQIIAVVTAIKRGGREIPTDSKKHRLWADFLHNTRFIRFLPIRAVRRLKRGLKRK